MNTTDWQTTEFERHRGHLRAVAYRMLGSLSDADDVLQEASLRLSRSDAGSVENMRAWLTTVVARLSLDELRSRKARHEDHAGSWLPEPIVSVDGETTPSRRHSSRTPSVSRYSSCSTRSPRRNGSRSCSTTCSRCR